MCVRDRRWPKERTEDISMAIAVARRARVSLVAINNAIKHEFVRLSRATAGRQNFARRIFARDPTSYFRL